MESNLYHVKSKHISCFRCFPVTEVDNVNMTKMIIFHCQRHPLTGSILSTSSNLTTILDKHTNRYYCLQKTDLETYLDNADHSCYILLKYMMK
ncbi:hypothetical protein CICLE_v10023061mg [Citrus x clementina]|uniref:Uncharacterized protein n=1 Tax=Citrus clementina TaxID=85681 RepID=V4TSF6_CITCL|nr:hypothetical protein CICLE_v10023061mg [Citrus x clementina]